MKQMIKNGKHEKHLIPEETITEKIHFIRGKKVMLDMDLANLYAVKTGILKRAVKRNMERFPSDFIFELTKNEYDSLRCQIGTLKRGEHSKYLPYAFTEQGVAMLSSVLKSNRAIQVNIQIMRIFTKLRRVLQTHVDLRRKIEAMEKNFLGRFQKHDQQFKVVFEAIKRLLQPSEKPKRRIGFHP